MSSLVDYAFHLPNDVEDALRDGSIFVIVVLFIFLLNFRTTAITLTAIPLSFAVTALFFHLAGLSINTMTLGGLAVAIGELVDDAIVGVENVFRRMRENRHLPVPLSPLKVIYNASSEVRSSIVFATIVVVLVFIPLFSLSGIEGRLFAPLLVSLTVTPVLCYYLLSKGKLLERKEGFFVIWLKRIDRKQLEITLDHPYKVMASALVLVLIAFTSVFLLGKEFLPPFNEGTATINVVAAPGTSLSESNRLGTLAEKLLLSVPEVTTVGRRGDAAIYLTGGVLSVATLVGFITLTGIASRNTIMMISHYLHLLKEEGETFSKEMVIRGSLERLVPVLMTALTAGLALIPLVLAKGQPGKEILYPVATVILGGLASSTLLDMIVTPVIFYRFGSRAAERFLTQSTKEDL